MQQMHNQVSAMLPCPQLIEKETILIPINNWSKFFKRLLYVHNFAPVTPKICSRFNPLHVGHVQYFELHLVLFNTQHCTWSFRSIARWSCEEIIGPCLRRPQAAAAPRNSNSPTFYLGIVKFNIFAPTTMHEFHSSPKWCLWPLNPNWLLSNIKGRTPEGTWGTAKPRSNSKLLGSPDHQVNWLAGSVQNSNTWWISQKVDLYCPMLILDSHSKIR